MCYIIHTLKGYALGWLVFGHDMILLIKYIVDWKLTCQRKQAQINYDYVQENTSRIDYDYQVVDKFMLINKAAYKYETP